MEEACRDVHLAFVESMFLPEHEDEAVRKRHMTVEQAAKAALDAGALRTELVHVSPRYGPSDVRRMNALARDINPTAKVAEEHATIDVPLPD